MTEGHRAFRSLGYYFTASWNTPELGEWVDRHLGVFGVPEDPEERRYPVLAGTPPHYALDDAAEGRANRWELRYGPDQLLVSSNDFGVIQEHLLWQVNHETLVRTGNFMLLHAGAVVAPNGDGVVVAAASGSGKTTLTAGLVLAGYGYLSDEAAALDPVTGEVFPYPKTLSFKNDPVALLGLADSFRRRSAAGTWHYTAEELRCGAMADRAPVAHVVLLQYRQGQPTVTTPVSRAGGLQALIENAIGLRLYGRRGFVLLAQLARTANFYALASGDLAESIQHVRALCEGKPSVDSG